MKENLFSDMTQMKIEPGTSNFVALCSNRYAIQVFNMCFIGLSLFDSSSSSIDVLLHLKSQALVSVVTYFQLFLFYDKFFTSL